MKLKKAIILTLGISLLLSGCNSGTADEDAQEVKPVAISVSKILRKDIQSIKTVIGKVKPSQDISVVAKTPGKVSKIHVEVGQEVKKGDPLLTIDDKDIKLQVEQAKAALNAASANLDRTSGGSMELQLAQLKSTLETTRMAMDNAKTAYENVQKLYENGAASKKELDSAETGYKTALEQYNTAKSAAELTEAKINSESIEAAKAQVKQSEVAYEIVKTQLENITLTAPMDGVISKRMVDAGEFVSNAAPAFTLVNVSDAVVEINVAENMINKIHVGDKYKVVFKSLDNKEYAGEVISVSPDADPASNTFLIRMGISGGEGKIKGGMLATVSLVEESKDNVMAVDIDCVVEDGGKKAIYLVDGELAIKKDVVTGISDGELLEVSGDFKEGDTVIFKGQDFVKDGTKVTVIN